MKSPFLAALFVLPISAGCSLGQGEGDVKSDALIATDCWSTAYDLQPDFFAAVPYRNTMNIRVQRGTDIQEVSDGMAILLQDVEGIRGVEQPDGTLVGGRMEEALKVTLSPGVLPPGATLPAPPVKDQPEIHMALYLQRSCHTQNSILYAVDGTMTFHSLFSGDLNEDSAEDKFTDAEFSVWMGDPRDVPVGATANQIPTEQQSQVTGFLRFYFERGQPGQPFP